MMNARYAAACCLLLASTVAQAQTLRSDRVYPTFAIGPTGLHASIEKGLIVTVQSVTEGSPAAGTELKPGDILLSVNDLSLSVDDPRVPMGTAIGTAEAGDGRVTIEFKRDMQTSTATIRLAPLGEYHPDWPRNCSKSQVIVEQTARYIRKAQLADGSWQFGSGRPVRDDLRGCLASLFLLSTGEDEDIAPVKKHARKLASLAENRRNAGGHVNWQLGYQGILLSEYYLRTGDTNVLNGLQELCNWCIENQAAGGWSHGAPVGPGYVQSGLMNHAGLPVLITLILARECGVDVDDEGFARAVKLIYRMAGHGCVAYGDHRSELWWSNTNGRNAMTACAFSLLKQYPEFRQASEHLALLVTDSYFQPEFGHTGGGFNVMWRGMASMHVPERHRSHVRRQMRHLAWYYDLCRQPGGGFSMLPTPPDNKRYSGLEWGTGAMGLTYTAARATLRITGAPPTRFSRKPERPDFRWGTEADLAFLRTDAADGFDNESADPHDVYALLLKDRRDEATIDFCTAHLRHYSPLVRTWAAKLLAERNSEQAVAALALAVQDDDPRVRRAVFDGISGYNNWSRPMRGTTAADVVSDQFLDSILKTLNDSKSAWWEIDGALFALGRARPADIRNALPLIQKFSKHEEWYIREAAFWALTGLHKTIRGPEFNLLTDIYGASKHVYARSSYDAGFRTILKQDKVAFDRVTISKAISTLGRTTHQPGVVLGYGQGGVHEAAHRTMMILKHFDPDVYRLMIDDFVAYLDIWEPYYQHSVWLITGSRWQPGIPKVLEGLGPHGKPIVSSLKAILARYEDFDPKRIGGNGKDLQKQISDVVREWETRYGGAQ